MDQKSHAPRSAVIAAITAGIAVLAVYLLRLDRIAGLIGDDAWYVLLGKALAQGDGFKLISSAASQIQPVVPPGFPAVLAVIFTFDPGFPHNILWLKGVSIAAMIGVGLATGWYFLRYRELPSRVSIALAAATVLTPALVFLATSTVMAEGVFIFGQMITIVLIERSVRSKERAALATIIGAAAAASATILFRSSGASLVAAICLYLLYARRWKSMLLFAAVTICCLAPWTIYSARHAPTGIQRLEHGGTIAVAYGDAMGMRRVGDPDAGRITLREWPARLAGNFVNVCCRDIGGIAFPELFRGASESGQEVVSLGKLGAATGSMGLAPITMVISALLCAVALLRWICALRDRITVAEIFVPMTIAMILPVPVWTYRYMLPLVPFVLFYLYKGFEAAASARVARIALLCVLGFAVSEHVQYILLARGANRVDTIDWAADSQEVDDVLAWMNEHLAGESGAVATTNPALVYLRTQRKSVALDNPLDNRRRWKALGIRYLVCLNPAEVPHSPRDDFRLLYQTSRRKLWIVEI